MRHRSLSCFTPSNIQLQHLWKGQENFAKPCWMREARSWGLGPISNLATVKMVETLASMSSTNKNLDEKAHNIR
jgi:hypothetical protein